MGKAVPMLIGTGMVQFDFGIFQHFPAPYRHGCAAVLGQGPAAECVSVGLKVWYQTDLLSLKAPKGLVLARSFVSSLGFLGI